MPLTVPLLQRYGVEPICRELDISPSTYYLQRLRNQSTELKSERSRCDEGLSQEIERVYDENKRVYGARKVWR